MNLPGVGRVVNEPRCRPACSPLSDAFPLPIFRLGEGQNLPTPTILGTGSPSTCPEREKCRLRSCNDELIPDTAGLVE